MKTLVDYTIKVGAVVTAAAGAAFIWLISETSAIHTSLESVNRSIGTVEGRLQGASDQSNAKADDRNILNMLDEILKRLPPPGSPTPQTPLQKSGAIKDPPDVINGWIGTKVDKLKDVAGLVQTEHANAPLEPVWIYTLDPVTAAKIKSIGK